MTFRRALPVLAIFLTALGLRLFSLSGMEAYPRFELIRNTLDDQVAFDAWAKSIAEDRPFDYAKTAHEFAYWAGARPGVYPQTPAYPYFVAAVYKTFGYRYDAVRAVQMLLGALTAVIIYLLALRFTGRGIALLCGMGAAAYGPLVFYEGTFLRAGPTVFATAAGLLALDRLAERAPPKETSVAASRAWKRNDILAALGCGVLLGAGALLRPTNLAFAAGAVAWVVARRYSNDVAGALRTGLAVAVGTVLCLAPVITANTMASGAPAFLSSNGPYIFFISNVHDASGLGAGQSPYYFEVKNSAPREEVNLVAETIADIQKYPVAYLTKQGSKLRAYFGGKEVPNNLNYDMGKRVNARQRAAFIEFWMLLPIAVLGIFASLVQARKFGLLYLFLSLQCLTTVAFYVIGRLRQPAVVVLLVFAGVGLEALLRHKGTSPGRIGVVVATAAVLAASVLMKPEMPPLRETDFEMAAAAMVSRGTQLERAGKLDEAGKTYARAVAMNPGHSGALAAYGRTHRRDTDPARMRDEERSDVLCERARTLIKDGSYSGAKTLLGEARRLAPWSPKPPRYLANLAIMTNDLPAAETALEDALSADPTHAPSRQNLRHVRRQLTQQRLSF